MAGKIKDREAPAAVVLGIGAVLTNGPRIHFATFASATIGREHLRRYLGAVIEKHGYALTKTPKTDARQLRFNARLGFYRVGEDEFDIHLRIDHLRVKETPCP